MVSDVDFVHTGPETLAGRYLRRFWQPVYASADLPKGRAVPIRLMSQDLTLYRGHSGSAYVVSHRCPHRGTQLSAGSVEGDDIACAYHGWKFNGAGACIEQPAEPKPFCQKVSIEAYPTREAMGLIFTYLGPAPAPELPMFPDMVDFTHRHRMDCNYFQSAENILDDVHLHFSHHNSILKHSRRAGIPQVSAQETPYGLLQELKHDRSTEFNHFIMPNICHLEFDVQVLSRSVTTVGLLLYYVPIDDTHHNHFMCGRVEAPGVFKKLTRPLGRLVQRLRGDDWFTRNVNHVLSGARPLAKVTDPRLQDTVMCVGQGAIVDRSVERLGTTDAAVILLRSVWKRHLRQFAEGQAPLPVALPKDGFKRAALH
jgi:5,5'-dehydrodivanillate O-demethylase